jgi:hypothetical protein
MLIDHDLDLDLHAIWYESSGIPTPPPCLVMPVREWIRKWVTGVADFLYQFANSISKSQVFCDVVTNLTSHELCIIVIDYVYELVGKPTFGLPPFVTINYEQKHGIYIRLNVKSFLR